MSLIGNALLSSIFSVAVIEQLKSGNLSDDLKNELHYLEVGSKWVIIHDELLSDTVTVTEIVKADKEWENIVKFHSEEAGDLELDLAMFLGHFKIPDDVAQKYKLPKMFSFSKALKLLKKGKQVKRYDGNGYYSMGEDGKIRYITNLDGKPHSVEAEYFTVEGLMAEDWVLVE